MKAFVPILSRHAVFCMPFSDGCPDVSALSKCSSSFHRADLWSELLPRQELYLSSTSCFW